MKNINVRRLALVAGVLTLGTLTACGDHSNSKSHDHAQNGAEKQSTAASLPTITEYFTDDVTISDSLVDCTLSDGTETRCYIVTMPENSGVDIGHDKGPWCPRNISDTAEDAGIWLNDNEVYDADGNFIENLATFYSDDNWQLFNPETGEVKVTDSKDACLAAARPDVDPKYQNYCVECQPEYAEGVEPQKYLIPAYPEKASRITQFDPHGGVGLAFNGIKMDAPAPVDAILGAYTLAPFDDCGGHVNPHVGYHYHAMTECSSIDTAISTHGRMLGVALDGFAIFERKHPDGQVPDDLDDCGGHAIDGSGGDGQEGIGYHYHAGDAGSNQILACFSAPQGCTIQGDSMQCDAQKGPPGGDPLREQPPSE
ncbi:YHYH protein [Alteromonas sp. 1_MG-2023]|uniref:YHYH protein n=1 Tax=Alteromonas sp. 1_MG-2023 TaxID=3062669 RepID=UPI0026E33D41|nr:YHYH protein [Alteromonas sp. 1_MG-2023]MDO6566556.1 YHYH protein [Alteromonas sp. 1_MG-2023]